MDPQTGEIFYGLNHGKVPDDLHPVLQVRLLKYLDESQGVTPEKAGIPGSHSEIVALDQAIKARERRVIGVPPRCDNCRAITQGVQTVGGN